MRLSLIVVGLVFAGCGSAELSDYMDEDLPAGQCKETEGDVCETGGEGDQCGSTQDCGGDLICAAQFNGDIGRFECQDVCIPTMDETRWCMDDAACCDAAATCGPRGYCMIDGGVGETVDEASGGSEGAGTTTSGTDTGGGTTSAGTTSGATSSGGTDTSTGTSTTGGA
jgi:hypothetical protein